MVQSYGRVQLHSHAWNEKYTVRIDHLKPMDYLTRKVSRCSPCAMAQAPSVADRITQLRDSKNLEEVARAVLKNLGEVKRPYLTSMEEKLLSVIEKEYVLWFNSVNLY